MPFLPRHADRLLFNCLALYRQSLSSLVLEGSSRKPNLQNKREQDSSKQVRLVFCADPKCKTNHIGSIKCRKMFRKSEYYCIKYVLLLTCIDLTCMRDAIVSSCSCHVLA